MDKVNERVDAWLEMNEREDALPRMVWVDIETTGLNETTSKSKILELSIFVTDEHGFLVSNGMRTWNVLQSMDLLLELETELVIGEMHTASGLLDELKNGNGASAAKVEEQAVIFLRQLIGLEVKLPLAGSNVANFDRRWLKRFMPALEKFFHYRNIDISTLKELARLVNPDLLTYHHDTYEPMRAHRGVPDLIDSIEEYRFYLAEFLWTKENAEGFNITNLGQGVA